MPTIIKLLFLTISMVSVALPNAASASIAGRFPVTVDDAVTTEANKLQAQLPVEYEKDDDDRFRLFPAIKYGLSDRTQVQIQVPVTLGTEQRGGSGDIELSSRHQLLADESVKLVAGLDAVVPTGIDSAGLDTDLQLASTHPLPSEGMKQYVHLNFVWSHNAGPRGDERENGWRVGFAYDISLTEETRLVADLVRELETEKDKESNLFELGIKQKITQTMNLAGAVGVGIGDESPDYLLRIGIQQDLGK